MKEIDFSKVYSVSKLELFDKCKRQYYFNYLDPEIAPIKKEFLKPRDYKTKGSAVHGAITLFYYLPKNKRTLANLKKCLKLAWFSEKDIYKTPPLGELGGFEDIHHERNAYKESLLMLVNFSVMEKNPPNLFYVPTKNIKKSFSDYEEMIRPIEKNIFISGKFDRIDKLSSGNLMVVDFKTGKSQNGFFQLEFYKLLAELNFDKKVDKTSYYNLKSRKIKSFDVSKVDSKDIKEKILKKIYNIKKEKYFKPTKSRLCGHCDFAELCH
jgi:CRISPR/Cas system-associated exonuclease Cas4 (RecB family)